MNHSYGGLHITVIILIMFRNIFLSSDQVIDLYESKHNNMSLTIK